MNIANEMTLFYNEMKYSCCGKILDNLNGDGGISVESLDIEHSVTGISFLVASFPESLNENKWTGQGEFVHFSWEVIIIFTKRFFSNREDLNLTPQHCFILISLEYGSSPKGRNPK